MHEKSPDLRRGVHRPRNFFHFCTIDEIARQKWGLSGNISPYLPNPRNISKLPPVLHSQIPPKKIRKNRLVFHAAHSFSRFSLCAGNTKNDRKISCGKNGLNILFNCKHFVNIVVYITLHTIPRNSSVSERFGQGIPRGNHTPGRRSRSCGSAVISASARSIDSSQVMYAPYQIVLIPAARAPAISFFP